MSCLKSYLRKKEKHTVTALRLTLIPSTLLKKKHHIKPKYVSHHRENLAAPEECVYSFIRSTLHPVKDNFA